jgi:hypothetical protein
VLDRGYADFREFPWMTCWLPRASANPTAETTMNKAEPRHTKAWVLIPAAHSNRSRSKPTRLPKTAATTKRSTICSVEIMMLVVTSTTSSPVGCVLSTLNL